MLQNFSKTTFLFRTFSVITPHTQQELEKVAVHFFGPPSIIINDI